MHGIRNYSILITLIASRGNRAQDGSGHKALLAPPTSVEEPRDGKVVGNTLAQVGEVGLLWGSWYAFSNMPRGERDARRESWHRS